MQQAKQNSIARFRPGLCGGYAEQVALALAAKSGDRVAVPGLASAQVSGLRRAAVAASPPSLLASAFGRFQLRQRVAAAIAVPSSSVARHNQSLQRTASPPAELSRYAAG
jgi:hypothetical protein